MEASDWQVAHGSMPAEASTRYAQGESVPHMKPPAPLSDPGPPPRREQYELDNHDQRRRFHMDRADWYFRRTGLTLPGYPDGSLAEQNDAFDILARNYRERSDR